MHTTLILVIYVAMYSLLPIYIIMLCCILHIRTIMCYNDLLNDCFIMAMTVLLEYVYAVITELRWLPVGKLSSVTIPWVLCINSKIILLDPPILFSPQHYYSTRCSSTFADAERCCLSRKQTIFNVREQSDGMIF